MAVAEVNKRVPRNLTGRGSAVGIVTRYGLDGPGIESRWGRDFPYPSRPVLGPTQLPVQWVPGPSWPQSGRGVALATHPPSSAEVEERVELYIYSPSGPSSPVLRWALPLPLPRNLRVLTLILPRSRTGTVWFYASTSNKRAARPKLYTKSVTRDLKRMYSRFTLVRVSIKL